MGQFEMVKLVVDIGLGASLLYLAFRFLRGGISEKQARQLAALDGSLKALVREAEVSGNNLNDQLLRRQQAIESTLRDLETNETKLSRSLSSGRELAATLEEQLRKVREELLDVERRRVRLESTRESVVVREEAPRKAEPKAKQPKFVAPEPEAEIEYEVIEEEEAAVPNFDKVNIFGEPITEPTPEQIEAGKSLARSSLQQAVEKIVESKRSPSTLSRPALDAVHAAAEEMLRAGRNLEAVASRTRLSLDEVRTLSQKVIRDSILQEPATTPTRPNDQRLGVLAGARRQEQVV